MTEKRLEDHLGDCAAHMGADCTCSAGGFGFSEKLCELGNDAGLHVECHSLRWRAFGVGLLLGCAISSAFWLAIGSFIWVIWSIAT